MRAVLTVVGKDKTGIIARVSGFLAERGVNILDISQTILSDYFAMIMLVDLSERPSLQCLRTNARKWAKISVCRYTSSTRLFSTQCTAYRVKNVQH